MGARPDRGPDPAPEPAPPAPPVGAEAPRSEGRKGLGWAGMTVWLLLLLPLLVFLPLILAGVEEVTLGTDHVEGLCRRLGIHGELTAIYRPVVSAVQSMLQAIF